MDSTRQGFEDGNRILPLQINLGLDGRHAKRYKTA